MFVFSTARGCALEPWAKTAENRTYPRHAPPLFDFVSKHSGKVIPERIPSPYFAPLHSPMKTLETARTADCCDPTGGRLRSPGLYPVFSFVLRRASKLPCFRSQNITITMVGAFI